MGTVLIGTVSLKTNETSKYPHTAAHLNAEVILVMAVYCQTCTVPVSYTHLTLPTMAVV